MNLDDRLGRARQAVLHAVGTWGDIEGQAGMECQVVVADDDEDMTIELHVPLKPKYPIEVPDGEDEGERVPFVEWEHFRFTVERFEVPASEPVAEEPEA